MRPHLGLSICFLLLSGNVVLAQNPGDAARGRAYAEENCAACHAVRPRETLSPLAGLASFQTVANSPGMSPIALSTFLQTPHRDMPNFMIPSQTRADVVAYITSLKD